MSSQILTGKDSQGANSYLLLCFESRITPLHELNADNILFAQSSVVGLALV